MNPDTVLIVGGGVGGWTLFRALSRRGVPVVVSDDPLAAGPEAAVSTLPGRVIGGLSSIGLADQVGRLGVRAERREHRSAAGRLLLDVDENVLGSGTGGHRHVRRTDLIRLLAPETTSTGARLEHDVDSVAAGTSSAVCSLVDGSMREFGFIVGADRSPSVVRDAASVGRRDDSTLRGRAAWHFMVPNPGVDCWTMWSGSAGDVRLVPINDTEVSGLVLGRSHDEPRPGPFQGYPSPVRRVLESVAGDRKAMTASMSYRTPTIYTPGDRRALVGAAAYALTPSWLDTDFLAVEDALDLAEVLAAGDWDSAGARYAQRRRDRTEGVRRAATCLSRLLRSPALLRNHILRPAGSRAYRALIS